MSDAPVPAPVPVETPVPKAEVSPTAPFEVTDIPVHPANAGLLRDPKTGKFLPKDATPAPAPEKPEVKASPAAPEKAPEKPAEPFGDRFAALAKKERELVTKAQSMKAELEKREADLRAREEALNKGTVSTTEFKEKPLQALARQLGLSIKEAYDLVTQQALNGFDDPATPAEQAARLAREEVQKIRDELRAEREAELERVKTDAKAQEARVMQEFRTECHDFLKANSEKYELANHFATGNDVYDLVNTHWQQQIANGVPANQRRVLQLEEAAQLLEEHFEKQVETGLKLKKVSAKVQPAPTPAPAQRTMPAPQVDALTNRMASAAASAEGDFPHPSDTKARLARAIAAGEAHRTIKPE